MVLTGCECVGQVQSYSGPPRSILIDVGTADDFLEKQLKPENFAKAAAGHGGSSIKLQLRMQVCAATAVLSVEARNLGSQDCAGFWRPQGTDDCPLQDGYDHSYFFMSTFVDDHVAFHAQALKGAQ